MTDEMTSDATEASSGRRPGLGAGPAGIAEVRQDQQDQWWATRMRALFTSGAVGVVAGQQEVIQQANEEFLRTVGRAGQRPQGTWTWTSMTPPDQLDRDAAALDAIHRDGSVMLVKDLTRPDGTRVSVMAAISALGFEPYRWVAVVIDLSRQEQLRRLALSEASIVATLLEDAPIGFGLISPDLRFLRVNRELAGMNGLSMADHVGQLVFEVLPGLRATAEPVLRRVLTTGRPLRDVQITGTTPADPGVEHTWLESFFPVRSGDGPLVGVAAVARDVTETVQLQRELAQTMLRQHNALHELQSSLLPQLPVVPGVDLASTYLSADAEVSLGGDWFDVLTVADGRLVMFMADVVGHGLAAVGLMARTSGAVRAYVSQGLGPAQVLTHLNSLLHTPESAGMVTAVLVSLDLGTGQVEYASAGHPFPLLAAPGRPAHLLDASQGPLLGAHPGATYSSTRTTVAPGSTLLLYTDGLVERRGEDIDAGLTRLAYAVQEALQDTWGEGPEDAASAPGGAGRSETAIHAALDACLSDRQRADDVCVLAATWTPPASDPVPG